MPALRPRLLALFLLPLLLFSLCPHDTGGFAAPVATWRESTEKTVDHSVLPALSLPRLSAASYILTAPQAGLTLAEQAADEKRPMASTTKIMTALVVLESCSLDAAVTVPREAVGVEGSSMYLYAGETLTVETLLYGLLLSSANDAAVALAFYAAGSIPDFADRMNEKAAALGLSGTHFVNPHGLDDPDHYTTARDLATLAATALANETFARIAATRTHSVPQEGTGVTRYFRNHNRLLRTYDGAVGVKTGYTKKSGRCLVSAVERDGLLLVAVTLNDPADWQDHQTLYDAAFAAYRPLPAPNLPLTLPVVSGRQETVTLAGGTTPFLLIPRNAEVVWRLDAPRFLYAGFGSDTPVGALCCTVDGHEALRLPLYTETGVKKAKKPSLWSRFKRALAR